MAHAQHFTGDPRATFATDSLLLASEATNGFLLQASAASDALFVDALTANHSVTFGSVTSTDLVLTGASGSARYDASADTLRIAGGLALTSSTLGGIVTQGVYDTAGGAQTITAAELLNGYSYVGASGGAVALTLPAVSAVTAALTARGITAAAGLRLPDIFIYNSTASNLTVTDPGGGFYTIVGTAAVNAATATVHLVYIDAGTNIEVIMA